MKILGQVFTIRAYPCYETDAEVEKVGGIPWYAVLLGYPVLGIWYFFTDQTIIQRALGAKSESDARLGPMLTAVLKFAPVFFMLLPGLLAYVLFKESIEASGTGQTYSILIKELLPTGLIGIVIASLLAALMSSVAAALNSSSTLVCIDIIKRFNPKISDDRLVYLGRMIAFVVMVIAILFSMVAGTKGDSIITLVMSLATSIAPSISAVFMLGYFWKRGTKQAAKVTFSFGLILGMLVFFLDFPDENGVKMISDSWGIIFMMQAWWSFVLCGVLFVVVSYLTEPPNAEQKSYTFSKPDYIPKIKKVSDHRIIGIMIILALIVFWTIIELLA